MHSDGVRTGYQVTCDIDDDNGEIVQNSILELLVHIRRSAVSCQQLLLLVTRRINFRKTIRRLSFDLQHEQSC